MNKKLERFADFVSRDFYWRPFLLGVIVGLVLPLLPVRLAFGYGQSPLPKPPIAQSELVDKASTRASR